MTRRSNAIQMREPANKLSIVVPFYNEEDSVEPLCQGVANALNALGRDYEVILVDDGSADETYKRALVVAEADKRFRVVKLRANFGQTAALYAGFNLAQGNIIVSMDGDLQNDPRDIGAMVELIDQGYDVVTGWREKRQDKLILRKVPSMVANWLVRKVTSTKIHDNGCGLRAYRSDFIKSISLYSEMHRLLPTIVALTGAKITEIKVRHHERKFGKSKYGLSRIYKFLLDFAAIKIILTLFRLPLFGFGAAGIFFVAIGVAIMIAGIANAFVHPDDPIVVYLGSSILIASLGTSLIMMGIVCDLVYATGNSRVEHLVRADVG